MTKLIKNVPFREANVLKRQGWEVLHTSAEGVTICKDVDACATWEEIVQMDAGTGQTEQNTSSGRVA